MRLFVSGATDTLRRYRDSAHLGILLVPGAGNSLPSVLATGLPWAADNAAFSGFDPAAFCAFICPGAALVATANNQAVRPRQRHRTTRIERLRRCTCRKLR